MELYGLHKIATEGSCKEAQPMAIMVTARAKWYHTFLFLFPLLLDFFVIDNTSSVNVLKSIAM